MKKIGNDIDCKSVLPFVLVGLISFIMSVITEWYADAVMYQFVFPSNPSDISTQEIENIGDVFRSQAIHYMTLNGRIFVHTIVQLFCGLWGKYVFAVVNALVWSLLPYYGMKIAGYNRITIWNSILSCGLALLLMLPLRFDPPLQINYVWVALMFAIWARIFFARRNEMSMILLILFGVYSLLMGNSNESFIFPLGGALLIYGLKNRFRFSKIQWVSAISMAVGAVALIASPGNWVRFDTANGAELGLAQIENLLPTIFFPLLLLIIYVMSKRSGGIINYCRKDVVAILLIMAILNYVLCIVLKGGSGIRMLIAGNYCLVLLTMGCLRNIEEYKSFKLLSVVVAMIACVSLGSSAKETYKKGIADRLIYARYSESTDGVVYLSDEQFELRVRDFITFRDAYITETRRLCSDKPDVKVLPESMKREELQCDTNVVIRLTKNAWLVSQSKGNPRSIIVEKKILGKNIGTRQLEFGDGSDIVIDSTQYCRIGLYENSRPYMDVEVRVVD